ncbi:MAG: hypothetical protein WAO98_00495 [Alphaproteobacteria bacterium]
MYDPFIQKFSDYLGDAERLPFVSPSYKVLGVEFICPQYISFLFKNAAGEIFGRFQVYPRPNGEFHISAINAGLAKSKTKGLGYGREFVRRAVLFATDEDYTKISTSIFAGGGSSFWFSLGFRSDEPCKPNWGEARRDEAAQVAHWKENLARCPDQVWHLAKTDLGRRVLRNRGNKGVLDLRDPKQRSHAFAQLKLPLTPDP